LTIFILADSETLMSVYKCEELNHLLLNMCEWNWRLTRSHDHYDQRKRLYERRHHRDFCNHKTDNYDIM